MTYSTMGEVDEHLTNTRFGGVDLFDFGADAAGVVVDDGFVFGGDGGSHFCGCWWVEAGKSSLGGKSRSVRLVLEVVL